MKKILVVIIVIVAVVIGLGIRNDDGGVIKIGIINPLTGPAGSMGEEVVNAIKLATSTKLQFLFEDDQCDAKKAVSSYMKLKQEGTHIFYLSCSGSLLAVAPLAKQDGNLILSAYAGSSEIRKTGDEVIRFIPDALSVADAMANYVTNMKSRPKIGLLYEEQDYAKSVALALKEKLGEKVIIEERYVATDTTFRTQITKLKGQRIDVLLYIPTSDKAAQLIYKELQTLNYKPLLVGDVNVCAYPFSPKDFGLKGICFDAGFSVETDAYKQFLIDYKNRYGVESNAAFYSAITYDIFKLLDKSNQKDVPSLKRYFLNGIKGEMSDYSFTPNGEVIADQYLKMFER